jgi:hypothetical protein
MNDTVTHGSLLSALASARALFDRFSKPMRYRARVNGFSRADNNFFVKEFFIIEQTPIRQSPSPPEVEESRSPRWSIRATFILEVEEGGFFLNFNRIVGNNL